MRVKLSTKIILTVSLVLTLGIGFSSVYLIRSEKNLLLKNACSEADSINRRMFGALTAFMLLGLADPEALHNLIKEIQFTEEEEKVLELRLILSPDFAKTLTDKGIALGYTEYPKDVKEEMAVSGEKIMEEAAIDIRGKNYRGMRHITPVKAEKRCLSCHKVEEGKTIGAFSTVISLEPIHRAMEERTIQVILLMGIAFILTVAILYFSLYKIVVTPIKIISKVTKMITKEGDLSKKIKIKTQDEIGDLAVSFNKMTDNLSASMEKEKKLAAAEAAAQAEKMASIGLLAAGAAHEINNPLFAILTEAEILLKSEDKAKDAEETLKIIIGQSKRIKIIIDRLLQFSRKKKFKPELTDINNVLEESISLLAYQAKTKNVEVIKKLDLEIPRLLIDHDQIQEVFVNMMLNAVQAMEGGGGSHKPRLTVKTYTEKMSEYGRRKTDVFRQGEDAAVIEFEDTGCGMDEETLGKMFNPFFTTKEKGTGLGLSICYGIIKNHNGLIEAKSKLGEGAVFIVKLPIPKTGEKNEEKDSGGG